MIRNQEKCRWLPFVSFDEITAGDFKFEHAIVEVGESEKFTVKDENVVMEDTNQREEEDTLRESGAIGNETRIQTLRSVNPSTPNQRDPSLVLFDRSQCLYPDIWFARQSDN